MSPEKMAFYSGAASGLLSLIFNWTPRLRQRFDRLTSQQKQVSMAIMTFIIAVGINLYQCIDPDSPTCTDRLTFQNLGVLISTFLAGAVSNQSIDRITPKPNDKKVVKRKRIQRRTTVARSPNSHSPE